MWRIVLALMLVISLQQSSHAADTCPPNLMVILDKSGSMLATPDGQVAGPGRVSRWGLAVQAINRLIDRYGSQMSIGLSLFPSDSFCGPARINIPTGSATRDAIRARLLVTSPEGATPTAASFSAIATSSPQRDSRRQQFILLLTDGGPNCATTPVDDTVLAISQAYMATPSIKTFVVGFGALSPSEHNALNRMALAGGVPDSDAQYKYYRADSDTTLNQALDRIIAQIPPPPPPPVRDLGMPQPSDGGMRGGGPGYGIDVFDLGMPVDAGNIYRPVDVCDPPADLGDVSLPDAGVVMVPGTVQIDTTCYLFPCPNPGDVCIQGACKPNPCANVNCPRGQYCYTNGMQKGVCHEVCAMSCPLGTRCMAGRCAMASPCADDCIPGKVCDWGRKTCEPDSLCLGVTCPAPTVCYRGSCIEDPCDRLVFCPPGTRCVRWFGSCEALPPPSEDGGASAADMNVNQMPADAGTLRRSRPITDGCRIGRGPNRGGIYLVGIGVVIWLFRRRRGN